MSFLLNGRSLAANLRHELKTKVAELGITPKLGVILVGHDPASHLYVKLKEQAASEVGIKVEKILLPTDCPLATIKSHIQSLNQRPDIHAILVQLPLPPQLDETTVIACIDPTKDADGFHPHNLKRLLAGESALVPGVTQGIIKLIEAAGQNLRDRKAVLLVNSREFAQPLAKLLTDKGVRTQVIYEFNHLLLQTADIIVVAKGQPNLITTKDVRDGTIIIDVGTNKIGHRTVGDVDAPSLKNRAVYLTPVPGGVGPMTVAMLLWNVYQLAAARKN
ncbi:MAG: bifunctional 5,10-methylenetetrahydrofolate dehydrogenase/5,10-methenyltetrahydrofolate cyclohydrolase [Candidatus Kerfeldbacteria bacterium]|nr:bifunctional 5,10-methylenetetrahydrofolate dehydrogenase/5,10-methenyltetrahydrofolate cyclohydrolase [Candidatus Kerfeldbacteria bacterium]